MVMRLPAVPFTVHVVTVVVMPAVNKIEWAAEPSSLKSAKVLEPAIVFEAVLAPRDHQILLKVLPPPENVLAVLVVLVILMVLVLPFKVSPVAVAIFHIVPVPERVHVPLPMVIVLVLLFDELNRPIVKFLLLAVRVPLVKVTVLVEPTIAASPKLNVPPTPLKVTGKSIVWPLLVIVCVPEVAPKVMALAPAVKVIPDARVKFP